MRRIAIIAAFAALMGAAFAPGQADAQINARQDRQDQRIDRGAAQNDLTNREERRLERQQRRINRGEQRARADGTVTARERRRLTRAQNRASRNIYRQRHDAQRGN
jgi:hypothetical protein